jgi:hypothetical protein
LRRCSNNRRKQGEHSPPGIKKKETNYEHQRLNRD